jgi:hypothetical protein
MSSTTFITKHARSVANKPLPEIPSNTAKDAVSLLLFYAYCEPPWTKKEHKLARAKVIEIGNTVSKQLI